MAPLGEIWKQIKNLALTITLSPFGDYEGYQHPIGNSPQISGNELHAVAPPPFFTPPGSSIDGFKCDYTASMPDWTSCQTATNKSCWLRNTKTNKTIDITSDYESFTDTPIVGKVRPYTLVVDDGWWNADGLNFTEAKLINGTFPGPLIEACWGDILEVTVINKMKYNGTSIHWHGLRQLNTMHMDGVNGVTQCPIAHNDQFTYRINLTQYGSSWLHSHFSVQYADGVQAPLTIHGPTSDNYDYPIAPLIISDWGHDSAFEAQYFASGVVQDRDVILNGYGNINQFNNDPHKNKLPIPPPHVVPFDLPPNPATGNARYLLRIINTAYASGMIFSIDNHTLQVVEVDFVPIVSNSTHNHTSTSVLVAIGQRYHVIVESLPQCLPVNGKTPPGCNFWIRTFIANGCAATIGAPNNNQYMQTGILKYNQSDPATPKAWQWPNIPLGCKEDYTNFTPVYPWTVPPPSNNQYSKSGEHFEVEFNTPGPYALASFSFKNFQQNTDYSFQTTYGNPTFLNLANFAEAWPVGWVVVPENYTDTDWIYLVLTDSGHPIHLHGHDFAILKREFNTSQPYDPTARYSCDATEERLKLDCNNPTRRDVVVLADSFTIIAFKTDNPGVWLMHCHIAFHASAGLALQIMERQADANNRWPPGNSPALAAAQHTCAKWNDWAYDCKNYWPGPKTVEFVKDGKKKKKIVYPACDNATILQNDSGV